MGTSATTKAKIPITKDRGSRIIGGRGEKNIKRATDKGIAKVINCLAVKLPKSLNLNAAMCCGTGCCSIDWELGLGYQFSEGVRFKVEDPKPSLSTIRASLP